MSKVTLGGNRLGAGGKQTVQMRTYERSSHDMGYVWRSTMASGTLVPFMSELGLPGDTFEIDLDCDVKTHPTIGPLFGSYKVQLDVFTCPVRLYQAKLHMNMLGIGRDMKEIKLPQMVVESHYEKTDRRDSQQVNSSSILSYLNIRGIGTGGTQEGFVVREFNAIPYLGYWDIYKNYYANKQEEVGYVVHANVNQYLPADTYVCIYTTANGEGMQLAKYPDSINNQSSPMEANGKLEISYSADGGELETWDMEITVNAIVWKVRDLFETLTEDFTAGEILWTNPIMSTWQGIGAYSATTWRLAEVTKKETEVRPRMYKFPLENIDTMRQDILKAVDKETAFKIDKKSIAPYGLMLENDKGEGKIYAKEKTQEGLAIKTYQSDLFNNWISTEWIDGDNGINAITAVDTSEGNFTIDALNLSKKVYDMLNRIAISGGSYDDWLDAVYTHDRARSTESPVYHGGLIKELVFQEVVSNAQAQVGENAQPLGTLAGRGVLSGKNKGGKLRIKVDEPSYIIGIVSITPRVDYSQGNKWDMNLKTMDDFHKPALDEIGFQDLITDQMAWFDTNLSEAQIINFKSAGKQPAWINYMTNVNQVKGNFAEENEQMFMVLNRRYEQGSVSEGIKDLTTYIDPSKFNHIFADTRLDAQNFWVQIGVDITARRKMSARVIPNL